MTRTYPPCGKFLPFAGILLALVGTCPASAMSGKAGKAPTAARNPAYASVDECIILKKLEEPLCRTAFANARAEFEEKTPRFPDRQSCESAFAQCAVFVSVQPNSPASLAKRGVLEFAPSLERVEILTGKGGALSALPVTRASKVPLNFTPRPIDTPDVEISWKRGDTARQNWQAALAKANRPPLQPGYAGGTNVGGPISFADPEAGNATDQPRTFPVSPKRWSQIQGEVARLKRTQPPGPLK